MHICPIHLFCLSFQKMHQPSPLSSLSMGGNGYYLPAYDATTQLGATGRRSSVGGGMYSSRASNMSPHGFGGGMYASRASNMSAYGVGGGMYGSQPYLTAYHPYSSNTNLPSTTNYNYAYGSKYDMTMPATRHSYAFY
jgi:hypothetical protein